MLPESLLGPYVWTRYDLLVLPPSFPYGGMENPCMTCVPEEDKRGFDDLAAPLTRLPRSAPPSSPAS